MTRLYLATGDALTIRGPLAVAAAYPAATASAFTRRAR